MNNVIQFPHTDPLEEELAELLFVATELIEAAIRADDRDAVTIGQHTILMVRMYESG